jgi:hypothetical protein
LKKYLEENKRVETLVLQSVQLACITWRMSIGAANATRSGTREKLSIITSRLSKSLEGPFAMILRSIACASEPVLFLYNFCLKLAAKKSLMSQTMTKHGWIQLESLCQSIAGTKHQRGEISAYGPLENSAISTFFGANCTNLSTKFLFCSTMFLLKKHYNALFKTSAFHYWKVKPHIQVLPMVRLLLHYN